MPLVQDVLEQLASEAAAALPTHSTRKHHGHRGGGRRQPAAPRPHRATATEGWRCLSCEGRSGNGRHSGSRHLLANGELPAGVRMAAAAGHHGNGGGLSPRPSPRLPASRAAPVGRRVPPGGSALPAGRRGPTARARGRQPEPGRGAAQRCLPRPQRICQTRGRDSRRRPRAAGLSPPGSAAGSGAGGVDPFARGAPPPAAGRRRRRRSASGRCRVWKQRGRGLTGRC